MSRFIIEALSTSHDRAGFSCGNERIDRYFRESVTQDVKRNYATCFVAIGGTTNDLAGFYTLSSSNIPLVDVPKALAKKMPRYPTVPAVLIGWLARHQDFAGQGVGELLLFDAIRTVSKSPIGAHAIFADAIDSDAAEFYRSYGFQPLEARPSTLFLVLKTAVDLLGQ